MASIKVGQKWILRDYNKWVTDEKQVTVRIAKVDIVRTDNAYIHFTNCWLESKIMMYGDFCNEFELIPPKTNFDKWKEQHTPVSLGNMLAGRCNICPLKVCTCTLDMGNPRCDCDCEHDGNCEEALYDYFEMEAEEN